MLKIQIKLVKIIIVPDVKIILHHYCWYVLILIVSIAIATYVKKK